MKEKTAKKPYPTRSTDRDANERFVHLRPMNPGHGFGTNMDRDISHVTAFIRNDNGVDYVSFAECDARDQFTRKRGRTIARRKWFSGKKYLLIDSPIWTGEGGMSLYDRAFDTWSEHHGEPGR